MTDSVRLTCLKRIQTYLQAMAPPNPPNNPPLPADYSFQFTDVVLGPITLSENRKRAAAGIVPGKEITEDKFPLTECFLPLTVEFRITWNQGDPPPQVLAEQLMCDIQRKLKEDIYLGGNAIDLRETGNEIALDIFTEKTIEGYISYDLLYRHNTGDPRSIV